MQIHISDDISNRLKRFVDSGVFASFDEAAEQAFTQMLNHEEFFALDREALDASLDKAMQDIKDGKGIPFEQIKKRFDFS